MRSNKIVFIENVLRIHIKLIIDLIPILLNIQANFNQLSFPVNCK
jgi:hypothetical protein